MGQAWGALLRCDCSAAIRGSSLPLFFCVCGRRTDEERDTDGDGETRRDPECTVNELLQLISFHIIECILRQERPRQTNRSSSAYIKFWYAVTAMSKKCRECSQHIGKISAHRFYLQFKIKGLYITATDTAEWGHCACCNYSCCCCCVEEKRGCTLLIKQYWKMLNTWVGINKRNKRMIWCLLWSIPEQLKSMQRMLSLFAHTSLTYSSTNRLVWYYWWCLHAANRAYHQTLHICMQNMSHGRDSFIPL